MRIALGDDAVVGVRLCGAPAESHSSGSTGAPLAPVTLTTAAAPPSPGSVPGGAGARGRVVPRLAVRIGMPASTRVKQGPEPGVAIGAPPSNRAVDRTGARKGWRAF